MKDTGQKDRPSQQVFIPLKDLRAGFFVLVSLPTPCCASFASFYTPTTFKFPEPSWTWRILLSFDTCFRCKLEAFSQTILLSACVLEEVRSTTAVYEVLRDTAGVKNMVLSTSRGICYGDTANCFEIRNTEFF